MLKCSKCGKSGPQPEYGDGCRCICKIKAIDNICSCCGGNKCMTFVFGDNDVDASLVTIHKHPDYDSFMKAWGMKEIC